MLQYYLPLAKAAKDIIIADTSLKILGSSFPSPSSLKKHKIHTTSAKLISPRVGVGGWQSWWWNPMNPANQKSQISMIFCTTCHGQMLCAGIFSVFFVRCVSMECCKLFQNDFFANLSTSVRDHGVCEINLNYREEKVDDRRSNH